MVCTVSNLPTYMPHELTKSNSHFSERNLHRAFPNHHPQLETQNCSFTHGAPLTEIHWSPTDWNELLKLRSLELTGVLPTGTSCLAIRALIEILNLRIFANFCLLVDSGSSIWQTPIGDNRVLVQNFWKSFGSFV